AVRGAQDHRFQVSLEELRVDIIGPDSHYFVAEIQRVERFSHDAAASLAFELVRTGILEVSHHMIDRRFLRVSGILVQLHGMGRVGQFSSRDDKTRPLVKNEHGYNLLKSANRWLQSIVALPQQRLALL